MSGAAARPTASMKRRSKRLDDVRRQQRVYRHFAHVCICRNGDSITGWFRTVGPCHLLPTRELVLSTLSEDERAEVDFVFVAETTAETYAHADADGDVDSSFWMVPLQPMSQ